MRPKNPRDLSQADLARLVERLQHALYWDSDRHQWDRDRWHDEETLAEVEDAMADAGLVPRRVGRGREAKPLYSFPDLAHLGLVTVYADGEAFLISLRLRTVIVEGADLECDGSVPHIDLTEPFGEDDSIEAAAAREVGLDPAEGFVGWDSIFDFLERHPEVLGQ